MHRQHRVQLRSTGNRTRWDSCIYEEEFYDCDGNCLSDTDGDGVCDELEAFGCTDNTACNYDPLATELDDSCIYEEEFYDCDGNCLNDTDGDGVCDELEAFGCTDNTACNYDPLATDSMTRASTKRSSTTATETASATPTETASATN